MPAWVIPAITAGIGLYQSLQKPQISGEMKAYHDLLQKRSTEGLGAGVTGRLYGSGAKQISKEFSGQRRGAGARASALGVGRTSRLGGDINAINAQQSSALGNLRSNISALDEQVKQNALNALGGVIGQMDQQGMQQGMLAGQGLGTGLSMLQQSLFPQQYNYPPPYNYPGKDV